MPNSITASGLITNLLDAKQLHIPKGAKVLVEAPDQSKRVDKPPFIMIGTGGQNKMYQAYPVIDTLLDLSKPEAWFMKMVFKYNNPATAITTIPYKTLTPTEKRVANKAYCLLHKRELVRRVKLHDYMINPTALITNRFQEHMELWERLDKIK